MRESDIPRTTRGRRGTGRSKCLALPFRKKRFGCWIGSYLDKVLEGALDSTVEIYSSSLEGDETFHI